MLDRNDYLSKAQLIARENSLKEALAAIKAHTECLMEPSEEMIAAGADKMDPCWGYTDEGIALDWAKNSFRAMLSAQEKSDPLTVQHPSKPPQ